VPTQNSRFIPTLAAAPPSVLAAALFAERVDRIIEGSQFAKSHSGQIAKRQDSLHSGGTNMCCIGGFASVCRGISFKPVAENVDTGDVLRDQ
jgi:hypothetical protein